MSIGSVGNGKKQKQKQLGAHTVGATDDARFRFITLEEAAHRMSMSLRTLERQIKQGKGPKVTMISARKKRIRLDHFGEFLDEGIAA